MEDLTGESPSQIIGAALGAFLGPYVAKLGRRAFNALKAYGKKIGSKKVSQGACFVEGTSISTNASFHYLKKL